MTVDTVNLVTSVTKNMLKFVMTKTVQSEIVTIGILILVSLDSDASLKRKINVLTHM